jgi:enoyl-CoA hydratase/carnithine racemase
MTNAMHGRQCATKHSGEERMEIYHWNEVESVGLQSQGGVGVITLQRSFRRNSMDQVLVDAVRKALTDFSDEPGISAIVLRGADPGFCAGSDLKFISDMDIRALSRFEQDCGDLGRLMGFLDKPIIAAVEGFAIGGGFTLATCCDLVVTSTEAKWSLPEVPIGWLTPWGIGSIVARAGLVEARKLCFGLDTLDGHEAKKLGLADYVVEPGKASEFATDLARKLSALPGPAVGATKRFFSNYVMDKAEAMDVEANRLFCQNALEADAQKTFARFSQSKEARKNV